MQALDLDPSHRLVPYSAQNKLVKNAVVLLPSDADEYGSEAELLSGIQDFIHRYIDVSFEKIASYSALFSWIYDSFNELPYLRDYRGYGCEDPLIIPFCDEGCPIKQKILTAEFAAERGR